jgi:hypothetical protein
MALRAKVTRQSRDAVMKRLRELVPEAEEAAAAAQEVSAKELAEAIKARAPRDSNEYVNSIEAVRLAGRNDDRKPVGIEQTKDPNAWGIVALYIWRFIEFGTRPHAIKARKKPRLVFRIGNKVVRTAQVAHPGMKARPHIFPTYRAMRKRIRRRVAAAINKAIKARRAGDV